jgi:putative heme transporter
MSAATSRLRGGHGSVWRRHRRAITAVLALLAAAAFAYYVLPQIVGLGPTLRRLRQGHIAWLAVGVALEACSLFGEVALFRGVFAGPGNRINWSSSAEISFAGAAATKVVAAAGAGGVAVTVGGCASTACPAPKWRTAWSASAF